MMFTIPIIPGLINITWLNGTIFLTALVIDIILIVIVILIFIVERWLTRMNEEKD